MRELALMQASAQAKALIMAAKYTTPAAQGRCAAVVISANGEEEPPMAAALSFMPMHHEIGHDGEEHAGGGGTADHRERHVAMRISGFLRQRRRTLEADEAEHRESHCRF